MSKAQHIRGYRQQRSLRHAGFVITADPDYPDLGVPLIGAGSGVFTPPLDVWVASYLVPAV